MSGQFPREPRPSACNPISRAASLVDETHSLRRQVRYRNAHRWGFNLEWPPMLRANAEQLFAFAAAQCGQAGIFTFIPPTIGSARGTGQGSPVTRSRSNLLLYSDDYTHWDVSMGAQGTSAPGASPDGTDMQEWHAVGGVGFALLEQAVGAFAAKNVLSVYLRYHSAAYSRIVLFNDSGGDDHSMVINWTSGGVASAGERLDVDGYGVQHVGGGVYRCWIYVDGAARMMVGDSRVARIDACAEVSAHGTYVWRAQLEDGRTCPGHRLQTTDAAIAREAQLGFLLCTEGWTPGQSGALLKGDYLTVAGHPKVYKVTEDVAVDANGVAAIPLFPAVMVDPAEGSVVTIDDVPWTVSFASDIHEFSFWKPNRFGFSCSLVEVV